MTIFVATASAVALSLALSAPPAAPVRNAAGFEKWGEWLVGPGGGDSCVAVRHYNDGARLFLLVTTTGGGKLQLAHPAWTMKPGEPPRVTVALDGHPRKAAWEAVHDGGGSTLVATVDAGFVSDLATARSLHLFGAGAEPIASFDLAGSAAAVYRARGCVSDLRPDSGPRVSAPPPPPPPPTQPPLPNQPPRPAYGLAIGNADYPAAALRAGEQGVVEFSLDISAAGRVTACTVTRSSGSATLDATTCRLLTMRARFRPATDGKAEAVPGTFASRVAWRIEPPPPPAPAK
jgi:protein TonB